MDCKCGFKFAGPGEFRNCEAFTLNGESGVTCPDCGTKYLSILSNPRELIEDGTDPNTCAKCGLVKCDCKPRHQEHDIAAAREAAQHTPGPWEWEYCEETDQWESNVCGPVKATFDPTNNYANMQAEAQANMALIAAAPALLTLAQEAVTINWGTTTPKGRDRIKTRWQAIINSAKKEV